ncbi:MAG: alpha/beta hydrolase [Dehalococcoidia bacterium]
MKNPSPDRVVTEEGIVAGDAGGRPLLVDVYTPPAAVANGAGVLLVHGGSWTTGDRTQLRGYGILLGRVGYTCVAAEYRLSGEAQWPAMIEDVRTAFDWMRANAGDLEIDRDRIAVEGNSAGGHLALMLAATAKPGELAACIAFYGPADMTRTGPRGKRWALEAANEASATKMMLGRTDDEILAEVSPITYASASFPPTMLISGNNDDIVNVESSFLMYRALINAGAKAELHIFEGQPHTFDRDPVYGRQTAALMKIFLDRHTRGAATTPK